jgi:glycine betaine catabolism B
MKLQFIERKEEIKNVYSFYFKPEQDLTWEAGQFLHYTFAHPSADERGVRRWFTISTAPFEKNVRITTRLNTERSSSFKSALMNLREGDAVEAEAPEGDFVFSEQAQKCVFLAGGIGITPFRSMLAQLNHEGKKPNIDLLYASRDEQLIFGDELKEYQEINLKLQIKSFLGDNKITFEDLKPYFSEDGTIIYISGPDPMVEDFDKQLKEAGVPENRIKTDFFPNYPTY